MAHAVIRTDLMAGTEVRGQLKSVMFYGSDGNTASIDNGNLITLKGLVPGEGEIFKAVAPDGEGDLYITAGVTLFYDESVTHYEDEYENEKDVPLRAYRLHKGDIFSVTGDAFDTLPTDGDMVGYTDGSTKITPSATTEATTFGKYIAKETAGRYTYYVISVEG